MFGFNDKEPNPLAFQKQLTDRFLEKVIEDLGRSGESECRGLAGECESIGSKPQRPRWFNGCPNHHASSSFTTRRLDAGQVLVEALIAVA